MNKYTVTLHNINTRLDKMTLPKGETKKYGVNATDEHNAESLVIRKVFDNCIGTLGQPYGGDGTRIVTIAGRGSGMVQSAYGTAFIYTAEHSEADEAESIN